MRKSILRFGALALMSMMSIGVWADKLPAGTVFNAQDGKGQYTVNSDGTVTLKKFVSNLKEVPAAVLDQSSNEYSVTAIGTKAFWNDPVGQGEGSAIVVSVKVGENVICVEDEAFKGVTETLEIDLSKLKNIGKNAFKDVKFEVTGTVTQSWNPESNVLIMLKASSIGEGAFAGTNLKAVVWDSDKSIPAFCFSGAEYLEYFIFKRADSYYEQIGESAFENAKKLAKFGWTTEDFSALISDDKRSPYYLPESLKTIGKSAFEGCEKLTDLILMNGRPASIETVGQFAFKGCTSLKNDDFKIFANAKSFASGAFMNCTNTGLTAVTLPSGVKFEDLPFVEGTGLSQTTTYYGVFEGCTILKEVVFPANFSQLGQNAFKGCTALKNLTGFVNTALTEIPEGAFSGCTALITNNNNGTIDNNADDFFGFPANVTTIGANAFYGCTGIKPITLPASLTTIGASAFENSTFTEVTFPAGVTGIGDKAFYNNTTLANIIIIGTGADASTQTTPKRINCDGEDVFSVYSSATLHVPYGCLKKYKDQSNYTPQGGSKTYYNQSWHKFSENIQSPKVYSASSGYVSNDGFWVDGLGYKVTGYNDEGVATVSVVDGLYVQNTMKENNANEYENSIKDQETHKDWVNATVLGTEITIPQYVVTRYDQSLNNNVFYKVTGFESLNTADLAKQKESPSTDYELTAEGTNVAKVTSVTIQAAGLPVPAEAFEVEVTGPNNVKAGFTGLTTFSAPYKISSLGACAFEGCEKLVLTELNVTEDFDEISANAFNGCKMITEFTIPSGVKTIGGSAFLGTSLTSINLPKKVRSIGANAFTYTYTPRTLSAEAKESGVKNVYVNWDASDFSELKFAVDDTDPYINPAAFGEVQEEIAGNITYHHPRNLHYPTGMSAYYTGEAAPAIFKPSSNLFQVFQCIKVNGVDKYMEIGENGKPSITLVDVLDEDRATTSVEVGGNIDGVSVTYTRDFDSDKWQCWFVPFDYIYNAESPATFAYLYDTQLDEDGNTKFEYKPVEFNDHGEVKILANVPYLVKPKSAGKDIEFEADNLKKTDPVSIKVSNAKYDYTFTGTYKKKEYSETETTKWYGLVAETGVFEKAGKDNKGNKAYINAYRFYMTIGDGQNPYKLVKVVVLDDEDATGISDINAESLTAPMYDVMGRQITAPAKGQVYIQNGVKKLAK